MCGKNSKSGFTLIELLIAFALIAVLMGIVVPSFKNLLPRREREAFISKVNAITRFAWQRALIERKVHRIFFDFKKREFWVEEPAGTTKLGEMEFNRVKGTHFSTSGKIPSTIEIKNFIIEGFDEMTRRGAGGTAKAGFI